MTKPTKWHVPPVKTQISLGICPVWSVFTVLSVDPRKYELVHDKTNKMACAPSEDSDQPGHLSSLISLRCALNGFLRIQAFFMWTAKTLIIWSDWADAQADLNLRWVHMPFCWFCHALAHMFSNSIRVYNYVVCCCCDWCCKGWILLTFIWWFFRACYNIMPEKKKIK